MILCQILLNTLIEPVIPVSGDVMDDRKDDYFFFRNRVYMFAQMKLLDMRMVEFVYTL
jgi:hypothetical protein